MLTRASSQSLKHIEYYLFSLLSCAPYKIWCIGLWPVPKVCIFSEMVSLSMIVFFFLDLKFDKEGGHIIFFTFEIIINPKNL